MTTNMTQEQRRYVVSEATMEIDHIVSTLCQFIERQDACGEVKYLARGTLKRIGELSDVIFHCGGLNADDVSYSEMRKRLIPLDVDPMEPDPEKAG